MERELLEEVLYQEPEDADYLTKAFTRSLRETDFRHERLVVIFVVEHIKKVKVKK